MERKRKRKREEKERGRERRDCRYRMTTILGVKSWYQL